MKFLDIVKRANHQLFNRKFQALLPILSLVVGATTMTLALGAGFGVQEVFEKEIAAERAPQLLKIAPDMRSEKEKKTSDKPVPTYSPESEEDAKTRTLDSVQEMFLSKEELKSATEAPFVKRVSPLHSYTTTYVDLEGQNQKYQPQTEVMFPSMEFKMLAGTKTGKEDSVVVSKSFAELKGIESPKELVGTKLTLAYQTAKDETRTKTFQISGVRAEGLGSSAVVYIPYSISVDIAKAQLLEGQTLQAREAAVLIEDGLSKEERERTREALKEKGFRVFDLAQTQDTVQRVGLYITLAMASFASVVILAALFGVTNTMSMSVYERIRQIGLMKALGMSSWSVFLMFAVEGALIGFWGAIIGVAIAYGVSVLLFNPILQNSLTNQGLDTVFQFVFPIEWILAVILGLMVIAFLASTLPARRAAKMNPIDALRYE